MGKVLVPYGVNGWVKVYSFTEKLESFLTYKKLFLSKDQKSWLEIKVKEIKVHGKTIIAKFSEIADRTQAESYEGYLIGVPKDYLPQLSEDQYYWNDLTQQDPNVCGRCVCDDYCEGTGTGCGDGQCRRISIMIFQSGQVIITGCCNIEKLEYIHKFIKKIHKNEYLTNN